MEKTQIASVAKSAKRIDKDDFILKLCAEKSVLDVGCIGQDRDFSSPHWLHNKIRKVSSRVDGVDILKEAVAKLKREGYSMYTVDELQKANLTYDVVLLSEVIEHVDDPVAFMKFYSKFMSDKGVMFVSTPNSNRANNFINILFNNSYSVNPEHVFWFCPKTFAEAASRVPLKMDQFYWANHYFNAESVTGVYQNFKLRLINILISLRKNFSPNMIFLLKHQNGR